MRSEEEEEEEEEFTSEENEEAQQYDDNIDSSEPFATLLMQGPQTSSGSADHPDNCMPCTFYCFTRRGCNRGLECRFCHLTHQSKLQQRREAWKKQQREKRKMIRERVAVEASAQRTVTGGGVKVGNVGARTDQRQHCTNSLASQHAPGSGRRSLPGEGNPPGPLPSLTQGVGADVRSSLAATGGMASEKGVAGVFSYNPAQAVCSIGQDVEFRPHLTGAASQFRLMGGMGTLPQGLALDAVSGTISGMPSMACSQTTIVVEADFAGGGTARGTMKVEVVDFTRGGFVIGHMTEFEPGRFMLILYVPEDGEESSRRDGPHNGSAGLARQKHASGAGACFTPFGGESHMGFGGTPGDWQQQDWRGGGGGGGGPRQFPGRGNAAAAAVSESAGGGGRPRAGTGGSAGRPSLGNGAGDNRPAQALEWW